MIMLNFYDTGFRMSNKITVYSVSAVRSCFDMEIELPTSDVFCSSVHSCSVLLYHKHGRIMISGGHRHKSDHMPLFSKKT